MGDQIMQMTGLVILMLMLMFNMLSSGVDLLSAGI